MEEEKSVSTLARYKVCKCSSCLKEATQSWRKGGAQPRHTAKPISLPVCLSVFVRPAGGIFRLMAGEGKPPTLDATFSSISDSICTDLQRAALIIESRGGGWGWWYGEGSEPAHCLCMNQGHWKIKADCGEIITNCCCGITLMRLGLTKPCLLYTTASLWDDYCD